MIEGHKLNDLIPCGEAVAEKLNHEKIKIKNSSKTKLTQTTF